MILLAAAIAAFMGSRRWPVLAGLLAGAPLSFGRLRCNGWILARMYQLNGAKAAAGGTAAFMISQFILILALALACFISIWVLCGLIAGLLIIPTVVMINSVTEALGITKNNFE